MAGLCSGRRLRKIERGDASECMAQAGVGALWVSKGG